MAACRCFLLLAEDVSVVSIRHIKREIETTVDYTYVAAAADLRSSRARSILSGHVVCSACRRPDGGGRGGRPTHVARRRYRRSPQVSFPAVCRPGHKVIAATAKEAPAKAASENTTAVVVHRQNNQHQTTRPAEIFLGRFLRCLRRRFVTPECRRRGSMGLRNGLCRSLGLADHLSHPPDGRLVDGPRLPSKPV